MSVKQRQKAGKHPLRGHHARLLRLFDELIAETKKDDRSELREMWNIFEKALLAHISAEEVELLPIYAEEHPAAADTLLQDHQYFRRVLTEFGINLDLHLLRTSAVEEFISRLRAHAQSEDDGLYPWATKALPMAVLQRFRRAAEEKPVPLHLLEETTPSMSKLR